MDDEDYGDMSNSRQNTSFHGNDKTAFDEFDKHVRSCNLDLKENILQQAHEIKEKDTVELDKAVEEIKNQEAS